MLERDVAPDRHPRAAQADREAERAATARQRDALERERGERRLGRERLPAAALAARLNRDRAVGERALARVEEARLDDRVGVEHQHDVPLERPRMLEAGLPGRRATGFVVLAALEHVG